MYLIIERVYLPHCNTIAVGGLEIRFVAQDWHEHVRWRLRALRSRWHMHLGVADLGTACMHNMILEP